MRRDKGTCNRRRGNNGVLIAVAAIVAAAVVVVSVKVIAKIGVTVGIVTIIIGMHIVHKSGVRGCREREQGRCASVDKSLCSIFCWYC